MSAVRLRAALLGVWLVGCSLTTFDRTECEIDADCSVFEDAFLCGGDGYCVAPPAGYCETSVDCRRSVGFGSTCRDGACVDTEAIDRCSGRAFPEGLLSDLDDHRERLVFGMLMDENVEAHRRREDSVELAISLINEQRGIDGRELGVVFCDVQGGPGNPYGDELDRPDAAVEAARYLVEDLAVPGIIGPASSGDTTRVYTEVVAPAEGQTVQITPSGTSPALTELDPPNATDADPGLLWRSAPSAAQQGELIAQHMASRDDVTITDVAIIHEKASFGEGVAAAFGEVWTAMEGTFRLFGYDAGSRTKLAEQVQRVGESLADYQAVFVLGQVDEMTAFMTAATDDANYPDDIPLYFGDTGVNAEIFGGTMDPRLFDNVLAATAARSDSFVFNAYQDAFMDRYEGVDPADSTFTANAYDAAWLMALGAAWATFNGDGDTVSGTDIARGLRKTVGGDVMIEFRSTEWPGGVSQFRAGKAIDVVGSSGMLDFDLATEEAPGPTALYQADAEGRFREILRTE